MLKIKKKSFNFILILTILLSFSCVSKKEITYFQNGKIDQSKVSNSYQTIFKPDDLLQITISALDLEAVKPFNLPAVTYATTTNSATGIPQQQTYLIDSDGMIDFPLIGKIKLGGLTRPEAIQTLNKKLDPDYIKNPSINIKVSNFSITILGDVKQPGTYTIPNERITILEAIGLAGDLNISGKRNNILVIREVNNKKIQYHLDLRSNAIFSSPAYYLQQNDVVYVEPNNAASQSAAYNKNTGLFISVGSILITLISILTR
ncbi:polysaccharide biosynthesis/export family protein [Tenacibaculum maritimum]|uniref:polysaccharide biosynthesis/export family protein n=1 Tax=Tenacibaculum maritimum TaxID=107401 RepID=UPI0012E5A900|nr:polysaccharide biosynthesis/export family protein [Tenacibaculum maritimum]MCD9581496.1 polysaccharide biosynthesis/export family protein [Tenacibaculum maritimum]MCD9635924.1 polysaccharide biosynthesis/export family protein [Tenacibaculum maritimum]MDB0602031.1 polysaccharide biosynthesis/export family protein [Tenacibaculum maritimum]MDB0613200.1 polysaccharide biosynthesis/export family protein [Tenacibaculum maritimum]CAA0171658.1 Polysaccharide biosynthesis/export protein [Tenacibacul